MMSLLSVGLAMALAAAPQSQPSQPAAQAADVASPEAVLDALYATISGAAGVQRDWARLRSLFAVDGRMVAMVKGKDGGMRPLVLTVDDYVRRAGASLERDGFFEVEVARRVQRFGDLAHVFSTYEGRHARDGEPFLRGINSVQLVRSSGRWAVLQILWEQEADAGPIPAEFLVAATANAPALPDLQVHLAGSDFLVDVMAQWIADCRDDATLHVRASGGGTGAGLAKLSVGDADLALATRRVQDVELLQMTKAGVPVLEACIGWVVAVVAVHPENALASLDAGQVRALVAGGNGCRWSQLGVTMPSGVGDEIEFVHGGGQFTSLVLRHAVLEGQPPRTKQIRKDQVGAFLAHREALLVTSMDWADDLHIVPLTATAGGKAVLPTVATCADGSYPLAAPLYVYYRDEPSGRVKRFVRWLASDAGKAMLQRQGVVPAR